MAGISVVTVTGPLVVPKSLEMVLAIFVISGAGGITTFPSMEIVTVPL